MATYIFQANPDDFDVVAYLEQAVAEEQLIAWLVRQHKKKIRPGDTVFLWRSKGSQGAIAGVIAQLEVVTQPEVIPEIPLAIPYWAEGKDPVDEPRVMLEIQQLNINKKEVVRRKWLEKDPVLADLAILRQSRQTNYLVSDEHTARLQSLVSGTGKGWSKRESMAALWLYNQLGGDSISIKPDSPVAQLAVTIGRAVTSVYNKLMNFRAIDPTDERAGLKGIGKIDKEVWQAYFDSSSKNLQTELLNDDFQRVWENALVSKKNSPSQGTFVSEEAENDDANNISFGKRKSRRGQKAFRKRLFDLYEGRCAISGVNVDSVLVAAHIVDHAETGNNHSSNGLLLRSDLHALFDSGILTIDPDTLTVMLADELSNTEYWSLHKKTLRERVDGSVPSTEYIRAKNRAGG